MASKVHGDTSSASTNQQLTILPHTYLSEEPSSSSIDITDATISIRLINRFLPRKARLDTEARIALEPTEVDRTDDSTGEQRSFVNDSSSIFPLEDAMYQHWLFKVWIFVLVSGSFASVTVGALKGYAF
jgi:hypothetical protein